MTDDLVMLGLRIAGYVATVPWPMWLGLVSTFGLGWMTRWSMEARA